MNVIFQSLFSETALRFITPFVLVIVGLVVEKKYTGRVSMFTNAVALYIFYHSINMSSALGIIVNIAIVFGLVGGFARLFNIHLFTAFYKLGWVASSVVTGILLLYGLSI